MAERICTHCGYEGKGKKTLRGSKAMEVFIWTTLLVPGPLYSFWRRSGARGPCPNCGRGTLVSRRSTLGKMTLERMERELGQMSPAAKPPPSGPSPRSSYSSAQGVSLTDNATARDPKQNTPRIDPDAW